MSQWISKQMATERGVFEVFVAGEGTPLCVTHLYAVFNASGDRFAERFVPHHQVVLVNLRGVGQSAPALDPTELSMTATVADLEAIRTALGFERWAFAGHSTGGMLALLYAQLAPQSLEAIVVVGAAASWHYAAEPDCVYNPGHPQRELMHELMQQLKRTDLSSAQRQALSKQRTQLSLFQPERHDEYFASAVTKQLSGVRLEAFNRDLQTFDLTADLPTIHTRALILCGEHDVQCPLRSSRVIAEGLPQAELVVFHASNHYPFLEEPDAFDRAVQTFFTNGNEANK